MRLFFILAAGLTTLSGFIVFLSLAKSKSSHPSPEFDVFIKPSVHSVTPAITTNAPKIQAAILLDVSNSMDGLIEQAKAQLWNMVSVMGKAQ